ncbi:NADP-dependent phosphogluconate dehydrogenase [Aliiroseovarius sp. YM-037]|uniref:NADP-dependent phosphogluconate dehydrogenase n=1 Tax=Aliiroseovarius sp. YM-037 TaxID=3341728 RepID=UPI003A8049C3
MTDKAQIGVYGLGTMGSALALNMADSGFEVAVTNRETSWIEDFIKEADDLSGNLHAHHKLVDFIADIATPRVILFMIPSGKPMDAMIERVAPLLEPGDTIIDGGNANFHDTRRRSAALAEKDLHFVGMGVSGGEAGARNGPSMMVGGTDHSWTQLQPILEAISAKFEGTPCVAHLGPDGAGHFVKTVHNGIEYADMQLIAEVWGLLRNGAGWFPADVAKLFARWNDGPLNSYLMEISAKVLSATDSKTGAPAVDAILDRAGQKGTGRWTVIEALSLGQSASAIEAAVGMRSWSSEKQVREYASGIYDGTGTVDLSESDLEAALLAARIIAYAQGFQILRAASDEYEWGIDRAVVAEIWRAGCIIRSALLDDIADAFRSDLPEDRLFLAPAFVPPLRDGVAAMRRVVSAAVGAGLPTPAFSASLAWFDSMRQARGTTDLIQAQRDFFGAHGFERIDAEGAHHGPWWD